jgi:hypothetical protein
MTTVINNRDPRGEHVDCRRCPEPCGHLQQCDVCLGELAHDYVHWNGAFQQCEECRRLEREIEESGDDRAGVDPIFGGYGPGNLRRILIESGELDYRPYARLDLDYVFEKSTPLRMAYDRSDHCRLLVGDLRRSI